jgi:hypothetical protein
VHRLPCRRKAIAPTMDEPRKPTKRRRSRSAAVTKKPTNQEHRYPHILARSRARAAPRNRESNSEEHRVGGRGMQEGTSPRFGRCGAERQRTAGMALTARPSNLGRRRSAMRPCESTHHFIGSWSGPRKTGPRCV